MDEQPVPLFLAPMAGVTDLAYRLLARECGADLSITCLLYTSPSPRDA